MELQIKQIQLQIQKQTLNQNLKTSISNINIERNDIDFDNLQLYNRDIIIEYIYSKHKKYQHFIKNYDYIEEFNFKNNEEESDSEESDNEKNDNEENINNKNSEEENNEETDDEEIDYYYYYNVKDMIKLIEDKYKYKNNNLLNQIQILINNGFQEFKQIYNNIQDIQNNLDFHIKNAIFIYSKNKIKYFDNYHVYISRSNYTQINLNFDEYNQFYNETNDFFNTLLSNYKYHFIKKIQHEFYKRFEEIKKQHLKNQDKINTYAVFDRIKSGRKPPS